MIRIDDPHSIEHISRACRVPFVKGFTKCIAVYDSTDKLAGGVFFTDYNVASMNIHVASFRPYWITPQFLWLTFDYPFNVCNINKLIGLVPESNKAAIKFDLNLGFVEEARIRDVFPEGAMIVFGMYKADCRFLKMKPRPLGGLNGQVHAAA